MSQLDHLLRLETANSALAFRQHAYGASDRSELLADLLSLANASASGARFLFVGVRDDLGGERQFVGVTEAAWAEQNRVLEAIAEAIDPPLAVAARVLQIDGTRIGMLCLATCDDPPYLLTERAGDGLVPGTGWVRRGAQRLPLLRADLQRLFGLKSRNGVFDLRIGFGPGLPASACRGLDAEVLRDEIVLDVMPLDAMPSVAAAEKLRKLLEAKVSTRDVLGRTATNIARLTHARLFGTDAPFQQQGDDTLRARIMGTAEEHRLADQHYEFEVRAHPLQLLVRNASDTPLMGATIAIKMPRIDGLGVSQEYYPVRDGQPTREGYPVVRMSERTIEIQTQIGIAANGTSPAFQEPPRLWLREAAAGKTIPVDCSVHARDLSEPVRETLLIRVA